MVQLFSALFTNIIALIEEEFHLSQMNYHTHRKHNLRNGSMFLTFQKVITILRYENTNR